MTILFVGNYRGFRAYSMNAYLAHVSNLSESQGFQARAIFPEVGSLAEKAKGGFAKKWLGYFDQFVVFPKSLRAAAAECDLVHIPDQGCAPFIKWLDPGKTVVTCHDLLAIRSMLGELPYWRTGRSGQVYQNWILKSLKSVQHMPCVSGATARDVQRIVDLAAAETPVINTSCFQKLDGDRITPPVRYIHNIAHAQPYKNRLGALKIGDALLGKPRFESFRLKLMGGEATPDITEALLQAKHRERIDIEPHPSNDEVSARVRGSSLLLFPSWDEGYGLPILESHYAGTPVAATKKAPMTEVGGDACIYIDPADPEAAAEELASRWSEREEMVIRGHENLKKFSPEAEAKAWAEVYRKVAA